MDRLLQNSTESGLRVLSTNLYIKKNGYFLIKLHLLYIYYIQRKKNLDLNISEKNSHQFSFSFKNHLKNEAYKHSLFTVLTTKQ